MNSEELILNTLNRLDAKLDDIHQNMVTIDSCKNNRENCKNTWSIKKISVTGGVITAILASIAGILKIILK